MYHSDLLGGELPGFPASNTKNRENSNRLWLEYAVPAHNNNLELRGTQKPCDRRMLHILFLRPRRQ